MESTAERINQELRTGYPAEKNHVRSLNAASKMLDILSDLQLTCEEADWALNITRSIIAKRAIIMPRGTAAAREDENNPAEKE